MTLNDYIKSSGLTVSFLGVNLFANIFSKVNTIRRTYVCTADKTFYLVNSPCSDVSIDF